MTAALNAELLHLGLDATLRDLPRTDFRVEADTLGGSVEQLFLDRSDLPGVLIYDGERAIGVLSRRRFMEILSRPFSRELYSKRPVRTMLQNTSATLFVLDLGESINSAVEKALLRHPNEAYEPVAVSGNGHDLSLVSVDLLLHTQSRILELANEEKNKLLEDIRNSEQNLRRTLEQLERMQDQLIQSEKMAALGQLVAGVAHEINTPIGIALTAISYLAEQTTEFAETYRNGQMKKSSLESYVATAHDSSELVRMNISRAAILISSFKQVAVDQTSETLRDFQMREFLTELLTSLNPEFKRSRHTVALECATDLKVRGYPGALSQVVTNLVGNAIKHAFADDQPGTVRLEVLPEEADVIIAVVDNGRGIPDEVLPRIFEPFFTTKRGSGGTGLGLHIVYNLVHEKLKGKITVESKVGNGTRFAVTMPRMLPEVEASG